MINLIEIVKRRYLPCLDCAGTGYMEYERRSGEGITCDQCGGSGVEQEVPRCPWCGEFPEFNVRITKTDIVRWFVCGTSGCPLSETGRLDCDEWCRRLAIGKGRSQHPTQPARNGQASK